MSGARTQHLGLVRDVDEIVDWIRTTAREHLERGRPVDEKALARLIFRGVACGMAVTAGAAHSHGLDALCDAVHKRREELARGFDDV